MHKFAAIAGIFVVLSADQASALGQTGPEGDGREFVLWYNKPAAKWTEALPLGNGTMGAMVFGGIPRERLQLNESTIWTGKPRAYAHPGAVKYLDRIRELLQEMRTCERKGDLGDLKKAKEWQSKAEDLALREFMSIPLRLASYEPMADLYVDFPDQAEVEHYRRELDLTTGLIKVSYDCQGTRYTREHFASYPDNCIVTRISADKPGAVSCAIKLTSPDTGKKAGPVACRVKAITDAAIVLAGKVIKGSRKNLSDSVIRYEVHLQVSVRGGRITQEKQGLAVRGANEVVAKLVAASNFTHYKTVDADPAKRCLTRLKAIGRKEYEQLYRTHLDDYQRLFHRASLSLGDAPAATLPTDERVKQFVARKDYGLVALIFHYARYLAISGSRRGGRPLALLGLWSLRPAWGSKYTCNINIEMNYWPMNPTGLPECNFPLFETLKDLAEAGSVTAREHYGAKGWVLHHNWDLWCATAPVNKSNHGIWVSGSGWMALHIWEHFLFTGDVEFLRQYYPVLKGAAQFYADFLYKDELTGHLISGPSNSPEHGGLVMGPTMDHQIIRSLFKAFVLASRLVGDQSELPRKAKSMIGKIAPNKKGRYGQLQEWLEDKDNPRDKHRHLSHLWGVFPGCDITWKDKEMFDAARQSLIFRGDGQTGWSLAWKLNLWARYLDGDHALKILNNHITPGVDKPNKKAGFYPNLFNANPPFVIDGNFGVCSGVVEMLIQSHIVSGIPPTGPLAFSDFRFLIHLLPALPKAWKSGSFRGLRARGGFEVSGAWENGILKKVVIKSLAGNPCELKYGDRMIELKLNKGEVKDMSF